MSTPGLFDLEPVPVKGQPWPWSGYDAYAPHCTRFTWAWNYCGRSRGHSGPHAEHTISGRVGVVWQSGGSDRG